MPRIPRSALALAAVTATGLAAGASPANAGVPCFANLPGPGDAWELQNDGSMEISLNSGGGSFLDQGHGRLTVRGVTYPLIANADNACTTTSTSITYPARSLNGVTVSRSVSVSGERVRWLDTITNPGSQKVVSVDFAAEVLGSQVIATSESGDAAADADDHWTVHSSNNKLFGALQWGKPGIQEPNVVSEDGGLVWEDDAGTMSDDATLRYAISMAPGQTIRLLHTAAASTSQATSVGFAKNTAAPFAGYSKATVSRIVNWGDDPDGDGVGRASDDCPSIAGTAPTGCLGAVVEPEPGVDPVDPPAPQDPAAPAPAPGDPTAPGTGTPDPGATPPVVVDRTGPGVTLRGLGPKVRRSTLVRRGVGVELSCTEACAFTARLQVLRSGRKAASTVQTVTRRARTTSSRSIVLKVPSRSLRNLARRQVTLVVRATDRLGNATTVRRVITLR